MIAPQPVLNETFTSTGSKLYPIPGFEGLYSITEDGRVWRHEVGPPVRQRRMPAKWLTQTCSIYPSVSLKDKDGGDHSFRIHRLMGITFLGLKPNEQVDHINLNKSDNRLENLRIASHSQNLQNCPIQKNNTSGWKGVVRLPSGNYEARIGFMKRKVRLGVFNSKEDAARAYDRAARVYYGELAYQNHQ